jgi:hypothetical protein
MVQRIAVSSTTLLRAKNRLTQFTIKIKRRGERKERKTMEEKKKTTETHRNSDNDTTDIVGKISTGRIQRHKGRL